MKNPKPKKCPECDVDMTVLLFMGIEPDGYVCPKCKSVYDLENPEKKIAKIF